MPTSNLSINAKDIAPVSTVEDASFDIVSYVLYEFKLENPRSIRKLREFTEAKITEYVSTLEK